MQWLTVSNIIYIVFNNLMLWRGSSVAMFAGLVSIVEAIYIYLDKKGPVDYSYTNGG
jgi:hypothetical protein